MSDAPRPPRSRPNHLRIVGPDERAEPTASDPEPFTQLRQEARPSEIILASIMLRELIQTYGTQSDTGLELPPIPYSDVLLRMKGAQLGVRYDIADEPLVEVYLQAMVRPNLRRLVALRLQPVALTATHVVTDQKFNLHNGTSDHWQTVGTPATRTAVTCGELVTMYSMAATSIDVVPSPLLAHTLTTGDYLASAKLLQFPTSVG